MSTIARQRIAEIRKSRDAAAWLGFAASPTFALMAWISANDAQAMSCPPASVILPVAGMAWMYVLMSLFHLSPWLRLIAGRRRPTTCSPTLTIGDR